MRCGVDIGGTNTMIGLVDENGRIADYDCIKTGKYEMAFDLVVTIAYSILRMAKVNQVKIESIGVGCPNINPETGIIEKAANLKFKSPVSLLDEFRRYFPETPLFFENDARAAALGEAVYGSAKGLKNFLEITLGTGLGCGIMAEGNLLAGNRGMAGEVGHSIIVPEGRECGCGRRGCLEQYVVANGIYRTYTELCQQLNQPPKAADYRSLAILAKAGDSIAIDTYQKTGKILGLALANMACCYAPSHIFIFGGVAQAGDVLMEPTRESFEKNLLFCYKDHIKLEFSGLMASSKNAGILGAAALADKA